MRKLVIILLPLLISSYCVSDLFKADNEDFEITELSRETRNK